MHLESILNHPNIQASDILANKSVKQDKKGAVKAPNRYKRISSERVNPRSITYGELVGHRGAKEWCDGIISSSLRRWLDAEATRDSSKAEKWLILDGPVEPSWTEALECLLDDRFMHPNPNRNHN